jgi:dinuclear metal center YbgI/SA1388 family protein
MTELQQIVQYTDDLLEISRFQDYCPNGLQVQGRDNVQRIVSAVTASQAMIDAAVARQADVLLVHHGYFWKGEDAAITGMKYYRIKTLLDNGISLLAYHLPLDAHPGLGNNAQLARVLELQQQAVIQDDPRRPALVFRGRLPQPMSAAEFATLLEQRLQRPALHIGDERPIQTLAWCSGAAQGYIELAAAAGVDAYVSGEISEQTVHAARELGLHYFAAGHHATERYGVQALGQQLAAQFDLVHEFVDEDNPV